ncbi:BA75_00625T0 [Komagataella pastoris]|uniref:BA75_00625T0 n=1 Tax=Komagataella pastoris TaxID=4922 RepID=A0A1B2J6D3_PICPA|nr:BA75_00625T0 [Komagataella pastoris]
MSSHDLVFLATTNALSHISSVLGCIASVGTTAKVTINAHGVHFTAYNDNQTIRVALTLAKSLFTSFTLNGDHNSRESNTQGSLTQDSDQLVESEISLSLDVQLFVESVNIHTSHQTSFGGNNTSTNTDKNEIECTFSYQGDGHPFAVIFEDTAILERVEFQTYGDQEDFEERFSLDETELVLNTLLNGSLLYDVMKDLKDVNTDALIVYVKDNPIPSNRKLVFISQSEIGHSKLQYPSQKIYLQDLSVWRPQKMNDNLLEFNQTISDSLTCYYRFETWAKIFRSFKISNRIKLQKSISGLTSTSLLVRNPHDQSYTGSVIDFRFWENVNDEEIDNQNWEYCYNNTYVERLVEDDQNIKIIQYALSNNLDPNQVTLDDYLKRRETRPHTRPEVIETPFIVLDDNFNSHKETELNSTRKTPASSTIDIPLFL